MSFKRFIFLSIFAFAVIHTAKAEAELSAASIYKNSLDSVVLIGTLTSKSTTFGSGFLATRDGILITNLHVVNNAKKVVVKLKGKEYANVKLLAYDEIKDIAILKIRGNNFKALPLADSSSVKIGDRVFALGNPLGLEDTFSDGMVSSVRKVNEGFKVFQITTPVSNGSSGGPLFNTKGQVIGITTASRLDGQNINFALPINYARKLFKQDARALTQPERYFSYTVKSKDTLYKIAKDFAVSVARIKEENNLDSDVIILGQVLKIPKTHYPLLMSD
ncbi:MAG: trypsin-like peptidase domain-containing protein [Candidatus Omnitrophica bacterium]|jgi:S1-C subfamily serine protease|nr:trypsin-like peptidase domain-containing protein [Candidatus Omnitrophota bacterium]